MQSASFLQLAANRIQMEIDCMMDITEAVSRPTNTEPADTALPPETQNTPDTEVSAENNGVNVNISIIRPAGYSHSSAFQEIAETLHYSFEELGFITRTEENILIDDGVNIILGAHLLSPEDIPLIPESSIIYNFEQITDNSTWMTPELLELYNKFDIWDYSQANIAALAQRGISAKVSHVPVGYSPTLTRIPKAKTQDIDVLFYGSLNERRKKIIDALIDSGLAVKTLFDVYGSERDEYISRSKIVLNLHYYDSNVFEQVRVSYLLANAKAVVAEYTDKTELDHGINTAVALVKYDEIVEKCCDLIRSVNDRKALEQNGFDYIKSRNVCDYLSHAIMHPGNSTLAANDGSILPEKTVETAAPDSTSTLPAAKPIPISSNEPTNIPVPAIINIGSGKDFIKNALNIDISDHCNPDAIADLSNKNLIGSTLSTSRFGNITLSENQFDEIIANDVLEHIPDLVTAMTNCLSLLRNGGQFKINVPYDLSYGAWQDPTHVRAFNERSWLYYTDWYWYLSWQNSRFDLTQLVYGLSHIGEEKQKAGTSQEDLLTLPRAIDNMQVVLTKRSLTDAEKLFTKQRMAGS
ncbi:hypothetical protein AB833_21990 [Chromatiales bacterium (ex Bugula neritina AB1)]|nr:hypothetical protein AB833_21990 [Chromatiales bacterium (ex Bugula neritina AB1)]